MIDVIVIGSNHHNTLGVIRSLGYAGIRPVVLLSTEEKKPYVSYSKYIKKKRIFHNDVDLISFLRNNSVEGKPVVIACSDSLSCLLDENIDILSKKYQLPGSSKQGRISHYMNKEIMSDLARQVGFDVPQTVVVEIGKKTVPVLPYPWIIKPLVSCRGSKQDIKRCYTEEDWRNYVKEKHCERVQVQQLIEKDYEFQLIGCSLNGGGALIIPGYAKNIRPSDVSNTGFLQYIPTQKLPIDVVKCQKFISITRYSGLFSMEFIHGKDGRDYFMEINFRNDGNAICVTTSGLNLPYIWFLAASGQDYEIELKHEADMRRVYVMPEFDDIILLLKRRVKIMTWLKDLFRTDCFMEFSKKDPVPFFYALSGFSKRLFRYIGKRTGLIKS